MDFEKIYTHRTKTIFDLKESDAGDIAPIDSKLARNQRRANLFNTEEKRTQMGENEVETDSGEFDIKKYPELDDDTLDDEMFTREEVEEILRELEPDEIQIVKSYIEDNIEDFCDEFKKAYASANDIEKLITIVKNCCVEDLELFGDCVAIAMNDIDIEAAPEEEKKIVSTYAMVEFGEALVNKAHIQKVRMNKKKAEFKAKQKERKRFMKTGAGKIQQRKAKLYMRKYRQRKKAKLAKYAKEYNQKVAK